MKGEYTFTVEAAITLHTTVEASSEEEAWKIAEGRDVTSLAHNAELDSPESAWCTSGEIDCGQIERSQVVDVERPRARQPKAQQAEGLSGEDSE